jgi:hypothetical protein
MSDSSSRGWWRGQLAAVNGYSTLWLPVCVPAAECCSSCMWLVQSCCTFASILVDCESSGKVLLGMCCLGCQHRCSFGSSSRTAVLWRIWQNLAMGSRTPPTHDAVTHGHVLRHTVMHLVASCILLHHMEQCTTLKLFASSGRVAACSVPMIFAAQHTSCRTKAGLWSSF